MRFLFVADYASLGSLQTFKKRAAMRAPGTSLKKAETLSEIKKVEGTIRAMKQEAVNERDRITREARREALELQDKLRKEADARAAEILRAAEGQISREREAILARGRRDAEALKAAGMANVDLAADVVVQKFQGAIHA